LAAVNKKKKKTSNDSVGRTKQSKKRRVSKSSGHEDNILQQLRAAGVSTRSIKRGFYNLERS